MNKAAFKKIQDLIAEDDLPDAIQLLLKEMPKNKINEAILHSARFKDLQRYIRLGLIDYKEQSLTKSQIRFGILESIKAIEGEHQVSVLVAGTGKYNLPVDVYLMAKSIGKKLGEEGAKLVCGGWEGVDYVVSDEFAKSIRNRNLVLSENLIQVVTEDSEPVFKGGDIIYVKRGIKEWLEAIKYSDIVILIGGEGGTYETFVYAHQEARPVIPIPSTGGDSKTVFREILENWDYWHENFLNNITNEEFESLNYPVNQKIESAEVVSNKVVDLIKKIKS